jgi:hypothetical protein
MHWRNLPTIPEFVPGFVRDLIQEGWLAYRRRWHSFKDIVAIMKENNFAFAEGVDTGEVIEFVNAVESSSF